MQDKNNKNNYKTNKYYLYKLIYYFTPYSNHNII